jgi:hypothetical protein
MTSIASIPNIALANFALIGTSDHLLGSAPNFSSSS